MGHRYLVDFSAFRVELYFESETSLTYTGVKPDGSHGGSETVTIKVERGCAEAKEPPPPQVVLRRRGYRPE